jgi:hypothetical protein
MVTMVTRVELSEAARLASCLRCPNCKDTKFGSITQSDGTLIRRCRGAVSDGKPCTFQWPESDDHMYCYLPLSFVLACVSEL